MKEQQLIENLQWLTAPQQGTHGAMFWGGIALGVLLVLALCFFFWRRWKRGKTVLPFLAPAQPHVVALAALREVEKRMEELDGKEFVAEVSKIVRTYIQARFGLRAPHRSTEEFLYEASQSQLLNASHHERLSGFLMHCDLVKFARHSVVNEGMRELLGSARYFIEGTIPQGPSASQK
jgi:hypothetical protein